MNVENDPETDVDDRSLAEKFRDAVFNKVGDYLGVTGSELAFVANRPLTADNLIKVQNEAVNVQDQLFPDGQGSIGGVADAFRHTYFSARLSQDIGADNATIVTFAHEDKQGNVDINGDPVSPHAAMDISNNNLGIRLGAENPNATPEELQQIILEEIQDGHKVLVVNTESNIAMPLAQSAQQSQFYDNYVDEYGEMAGEVLKEVARQNELTVIDAINEVNDQPALFLETARQMLSCPEKDSIPYVDQMTAFVEEAGGPDQETVLTIADYNETLSYNTSADSVDQTQPSPNSTLPSMG